MFSVKQKRYLNDVSQILEGLGIGLNSQRRMSQPDRIVASLRTRNGKRFDINFFIDGTEVVYESVVAKAVSGDPNNALRFYQTLLTYNSTASKINFSLVSSNNGWLIILKGAQEYKYVDANFVHDLLMHYDLAYSSHVERIMHLAQELCLTFSGKLDEAIRLFVEGIVE
jgi:hypothetical protein